MFTILFGIRLSAKVIELHVRDTRNATLEHLMRKGISVTLGETVIRNWQEGAYQKFRPSKEITETLKIDIVAAFEAMSTVTASKQVVEYSTKFSNPHLDQNQIREAFFAALNCQKCSHSALKMSYIQKQSKRFQAELDIVLGSCTKQKVSAVVTFFENYALDYTVMAEITGVTNDGNILLWSELVKILPQSPYVKISESAVLLEAHSNAFVDFAGNILITTRKAEPLPSCVD